MDQGLNRGFVEVAQVGGRLTGFLTEHEGLWVDEAKRVNYDFAFDGLDGVHDYSDGAGGELFKGLLGIDIDGGKPAAEPGMRMVPADNCLWSIEGIY